MGKIRRMTIKRRTARKRQNGGMAPVSYTIQPTQRQPTEAIMEWATTAGGGAIGLADFSKKEQAAKNIYNTIHLNETELDNRWANLFVTIPNELRKEVHDIYTLERKLHPIGWSTSKNSTNMARDTTNAPTTIVTNTAAKLRSFIGGKRRHKRTHTKRN